MNKTNVSCVVLALLICAAILWRVLCIPGNGAETPAEAPASGDTAASGNGNVSAPKGAPAERVPAPPPSPESRPVDAVPADPNTSALLTVRVLEENGAPVPGAMVGTVIVPFYQGEDRFVSVNDFGRFWGNTTVIRNAADLSSTSAATDAEGKAVFKVTGFHDPEIRQSAIRLSVVAEGFVHNMKTLYVLKVMSVLSGDEIVFHLTRPVVLKGKVTGFLKEDQKDIFVTLRVYFPDRKDPWINRISVGEDGVFEAAVPPRSDIHVFVSSSSLKYGIVKEVIPSNMVHQYFTVDLERTPEIETDLSVVRIQLAGPDEFLDSRLTRSYQAHFYMREDDPPPYPATVGFNNTRSLKTRVDPGLCDILVAPLNPNDVAWGEKTLNVPPRSTIEETIDLKPAPKVLFTIRPPEGVSREEAGRGLRIDLERQFAGVYRRAGWITVGFESQKRVYAATGIVEAYVPGGHLRFKTTSSVDGREYVSEPFERFLFDGEVFEREIQLVPRAK